jgi:hypothetical protein
MQTNNPAAQTLKREENSGNFDHNSKLLTSKCEIDHFFCNLGVRKGANWEVKPGIEVLVVLVEREGNQGISESEGRRCDAENRLSPHGL